VGGSKAYICGHLIYRVAGSSPDEGIDFHLLCFLCVVKLGSGLCDGLITHSEESYLECVCVCVCVCVCKGKGKGYPCTCTEALYRPYGP